ncbi:hypothetical protein BH24CHL6_BH24CHL6_03380 [soil metagenome]
MKSVSVSLAPGAGRFVALGSHRGEQISVNAPKLPGEPRGPTGFSATELLLAAAGACSAWDVVEIVRKRRQELAALEVTVEGEQAEEPPWQYERITLHFRISGEGLRRGVLERMIRLSCVRYCSVLATVKGVAHIEATLELVDGAGTSTGRQPVRLAIEPGQPLEAEAEAEEVEDVGPPATDED